MIFYIPVKKQVCTLIDIYNKTQIKPIEKKINTIDRRIARAQQELSDIQSSELHKINIEDAFLNKKYVFIFRELNTLIYSVSQSIEKVVKHKCLVSIKHLNVCIQMMRRFNEKRMFMWLVEGMGETYYKTQSINNTYKLLPPIFRLLMRMEKLVKTRIRRNTIYIRPQIIHSFVKEINLFKKQNNKLWISFYTSNVPYILKNNNFSDILIQHIYEFVYGVNIPFEYSYKRRRSLHLLPQP